MADFIEGKRPVIEALRTEVPCKRVLLADNVKRDPLIEDVLRKYAPDAMVFNSRYATIRWVGQEEGYASDPVWNAVGRYDALSGVSTQINGRPDGEVWLPIVKRA